MAKIVQITETATEKTFEVCLAAKCSTDDAEHAERHHRSWSWALPADPMTEADMIREVKLLAREEQKRIVRLRRTGGTARAVSIKI